MKHTPGPWKVLEPEKGKPYLRVRGTRLGHRYKIANVIPPVYEGSGQNEKDETIANAKLIAYAPSLVAEVELLLKGLDTVNGLTVVQPHDVANLRVALAQSTGETL